MFTGPEIEALFADLGSTHVVWVPDSSIGLWEQSLASSSRLRLMEMDAMCVAISINRKWKGSGSAGLR